MNHANALSTPWISIFTRRFAQMPSDQRERMTGAGSSAEAVHAIQSSGYRKKIAAFQSQNATLAAQTFVSRRPRKCGRTRSEKPKIMLLINPNSATWTKRASGNAEIVFE